ncbi:hypothetical protein [Streptomyces hesseae]|uniref:Terminase small subunit n=1 Tax=Streptomyces hesseae TaxID=3075519 RepID=A0ABU2SVC8_9ACTN|nr:hypothetical protein [Streptomyces sp. DSM 40473]MDT0451859.1 hypothetical protein [Streptomyces sp. DSM 40473]
MGARGPVPKRSAERRRRNKDGAELVHATSAPGLVEWPDPDASWHAIACDWYRSLAASGQAQFYEPSDVATARYVAEAMSRNLAAGQRFSAQLFAAVSSAMTELLTTEGARRRVRIELERAPAEQETPAGVTAIAAYRAALGA